MPQWENVTQELDDTAMCRKRCRSQVDQLVGRTRLVSEERPVSTDEPLSPYEALGPTDREKPASEAVG